MKSPIFYYSDKIILKFCEFETFFPTKFLDLPAPLTFIDPIISLQAFVASSWNIVSYTLSILLVLNPYLKPGP